VRTSSSSSRGAGHRSLRPVDLDWVEGYTPEIVSEVLWESKLRDFVVPAVIELAPTGCDPRGSARALIRLVTWCLDQGIELNRELVLHPDNVERFVLSLPGGSIRATCRGLLRRMGPALTRTAPWGPRPTPIPASRRPPSYSPTELELLRSAARAQPSPVRRKHAMAMIALGAGAGLDGRWAVGVRARDILAIGTGIAVRAGPPMPRTVPVLGAFEADLMELAAGDGDRLLLGGRPGSWSRCAYIAGHFKAWPGVPPLSANRLRSTWLVWHLRAGTRLPEFLKAAGLTTHSNLSDLFEWVDPLSSHEAVRQLQGRPS
jgi:hypothetical protein